jgi:hypothetical protein
MTATLELFERQNKRAEPGGAANAAPPHR